MTMSGDGLLPSWNEGAAKAAILSFVEQTVTSAVPVEERIAVFDADGTLWCEQPVPVEADFLLRRLAEMATADPKLRDRQPWKAAYEHDNDWLGKVITEHYAGDDTKAQTLLGGVSAAYAGIGVEDFEAKSDAFLRSAQHPTLGRGSARHLRTDMWPYRSHGPAGDHQAVPYRPRARSRRRCARRQDYRYRPTGPPSPETSVPRSAASFLSPPWTAFSESGADAPPARTQERFPARR
jgi:hypothetical protein